MRRVLWTVGVVTVAHLVAACLPPPRYEPPPPPLRCQFSNREVFSYTDRTQCPVGSRELEPSEPALPARPTAPMRYCRTDAGRPYQIPASATCEQSGMTSLAGDP